jgi:hypothetical protein
MKNFFGHLKEEYLRHFRKPTFEEAGQLIAEYFYNYERIQLKTKQTPFEFRCLPHNQGVLSFYVHLAGCSSP